MQAIAAHIVFVHEIDVLQSSVVELEIADVIYLHSSGLFDDGCPGFVEILHEKSLPLWVGEGEIVEFFELRACVAEECLRIVELWEILVAQGLEVANEVFLEIFLALIARCGFSEIAGSHIFVEHDEVIALCNRIIERCGGIVDV